MSQTPLMYRLTHAAGGIASTTRFVRTHVNGQFFRVQIQVERGGSGIVQRFNDDINARCIDHPSEIVGDLFKAQGYSGDECAYGRGNMSPLSEHCNFPYLERIYHTIGRKTHRVPDSSGHLILQQIIDELDSQDLSSGGLAACRAYLDSAVDVDWLATAYAILNFGQVSCAVA